MKEYYDNDLTNEIEDLIINKRLDTAKEKIDDYLQKYPHERKIKSIILKYYIATDELDKAYEYALDNKDTTFRTKQLYILFYKEYGRLLVKLNKFEEAEEVLKEAIDYTGEDNHSFVTLLGTAYSMNNQYEKAVELYKKHENFQNKNDLNISLCKIYYVNNKYEEAIICANKTDDHNLKSMQLKKKYYYLGKSYLMLGKNNEALENLKKVLTTKDDYYYKAYFLIARIYTFQGKFIEASHICDEFIKANRCGSSVTNLMSDIYGALNNPDRMHNSFMFLDPREEDYKQGKICFECLDFEQAIKYFEKYLLNKFKPHEEEVKYYLILANFKCQRYQECLKLIYEYGKNDEHQKDLRRIEFYSKYKLGEEVYPISYTSTQMIKYSEYAAYSHITEKHLGVGFGTSISNRDFFKDIKKYLTKDRYNPNYSLDAYELKFEDFKDYIYSYSITNDRLVVICVPNTNHILTIYPDNGNYTINDDLDIEESDLKKNKKILSRTEKFNQKYAKFMK